MNATQGTSRREERQNKAASGFLGVVGFKSGNRQTEDPSFSSEGVLVPALC